MPEDLGSASSSVTLNMLPDTYIIAELMQHMVTMIKQQGADEETGRRESGENGVALVRLKMGFG